MERRIRTFCDGGDEGMEMRTLSFSRREWKGMRKAFLVRTTAGLRRPSKDRGQLAWELLNESHHRYRFTVL
jgi:hypothetical protein